MVPSASMATKILCVIGPTASGKTARAVSEALTRGGEVISVDSRQVYRSLDIGTEKIRPEEMRGIPHHLIDIREPEEIYSAGDFVHDASCLIEDVTARGKLPILAGGSHFYFDALLHGLPAETPPNPALRARLEALSDEKLLKHIEEADPERAAALDPKNRRRLIRALEIIETHGHVPHRKPLHGYDVEWILLEPGRKLRERIDARLSEAFERGLVEEVRSVRARVGDERLDELGLEYRVIGEFLRGEREEALLMQALSAKLWQYARRQKAWLRKLTTEPTAEAT